MKLFVDDLREPYEGWHLARTVTEAIRVLATAPEQVDEVSLDHDITHGQETCPETFEAVARYIILMPPETRPNKIHIHTANVIGARVLLDLFSRAGITADANLVK